MWSWTPAQPSRAPAWVWTEGERFHGHSGVDVKCGLLSLQFGVEITFQDCLGLTPVRLVTDPIGELGHHSMAGFDARSGHG